MNKLDTLTTEQWLTTDDHTLATQIGVHQVTVARRRKALGHPKVRKAGSGRPARVKLSRFDLDKPDVWNATNLGVTRQRAGQMRKKLTSEPDKKEEWV